MAQDWKSLLTQLGVIVLGVLIALGIGHGLEAWSWHRAANDAVTRKIEPELHEAMDHMAERLLVAGCIKTRLDGLETQLLAANGKWTPIAPGATLFTVMPRGPSSTARSRISIRRPPLAAQ